MSATAKWLIRTMDNRTVNKSYLVAVDTALVSLNRERWIVLPAAPVGLNNMLIDMDDCFHAQSITRSSSSS